MLYAALVTFVLAAILTPLLAAWARRRRYLDIPNDRSLHVVATPRIGGVALIVSFLVGVAAVAGSLALGWQTTVLLTGALVVAAVGLADDFRPLPPLVRLAVQFAIAFAVTSMIATGAGSAASAAGWAARLVSVVWIAGLINAYNFMDGVDGLAGVQGVVAGVGWAVVGALAGWRDVSALGVLIAAASGGFLLHNWHPASVFMGDACSGFLGYLFAALPLLAPAGQPTSWWCSALLVWPFVFDTGFTLLRRARRGENLLKAHRSHIYQRFVLTGYSHREITVVYGGLAALGGLSAIFITTHQHTGTIVSGLGIAIAAGALCRVVTAREAASARETIR